MPRATFILTLDCEGKWGMADHITAHHDQLFTSAGLRGAYGFILDLCDAMDISATFAFAWALTLGREQYPDFQERMEADPASAAWCARFRQDLAAGNSEGWLEPGLLDLVTSRNRHEIASHGFTHLVGARGPEGRARLARELQMIRDWSSLKGLNPQTYVFPRNEVYHPEVLKDFGYVGYRTRLAVMGGRLGKIQNLAREINILTQAQPHAGKAPLIEIPPGHFFNWRRGVRRRVPPGLTLLRWKHIVADAIRKGTVCHLWLHPHNLLDGQLESEVLESVLAHVGQRIRAGDIHVATQRAYCQSLVN